MKAIIARLKEILNGVFTSFKGAVKKDDEYTVICSNGMFYPLINGKYIADIHGNLYLVDKYTKDIAALVINFPTNAQAMAFIDEYKAR